MLATTERVSGTEARELLIECLATLGRNRYNIADGVRVSPAQGHFRAELMLRDAFDAAGGSFDEPTLLAVFDAADEIARSEAITHPGLVAQLGHLTSYLMQRAYV